ncbi:hypothetical protein ABIA72_003676 [Stenotrophomonas rhizophila]
MDVTDRHARPGIAGCRGVDADPGVIPLWVPVATALRGERILATGHRRHHALQAVCPGRHGLGRISQRMARSGHAFGSGLSSGCQAPQTCSWLRRQRCCSPGSDGCQLRPMQSRYRCRNALWPARPLYRARRPTQPSSCQPGGRACRRLAAGRGAAAGRWALTQMRLTRLRGRPVPDDGTPRQPGSGRRPGLRAGVRRHWLLRRGRHSAGSHRPSVRRSG